MFTIIIHTLLLSVLFIVTLFPGTVYVVLSSRIVPYKIRKLNEYYLYDASLAIVLLVNAGLFFSDVLVQVPAFLAAVAVCFCLIRIIQKKTVKLDWGSTEYARLNVLLAIPILEELVFRYAVFNFSEHFKLPAIQFVVLSTLAFTLSHVFHQGSKAWSFVFFAAVQGITFVYFRNVFICILFHIIYNVLVNTDRIADRYKREKTMQNLLPYKKATNRSASDGTAFQ